MKVVGLVGESGTGKTTIAVHLERQGAGRIDADTLAHTLLGDDQEILRRVREYFGDDVLTAGEIDRKKLGAVVFSDPDGLEALNQIVHPAVIEECAQRVETFREAGFELVVVDAALLLEVELPFVVDLTVALRASREEQTRRLLAKGGVTRAEVAVRLDSQAHLEKSFYRADVVLDTNRPLPLVLDEIDALVQVLLADAGGTFGGP
jgi:dephospho-CoA kinase